MIAVLLFSAVAASTAPSFYFTVGSIPAGCPSVQTFQDGQSYGPCNGGQGVKYSSASKYWAATYDAASHCGDTITMTYQGKSIQLVVMDQCPGCGDGHVDMGLDALIELTGSAEVACAINLPLAQVEWSYGGSAPSSPQAPETAKTPETPSTPVTGSNPEQLSGSNDWEPTKSEDPNTMSSTTSEPKPTTTEPSATTQEWAVGTPLRESPKEAADFRGFGYAPSDASLTTISMVVCAVSLILLL